METITLPVLASRRWHLVLFEMCIVQGFKARTLELTQNPGFIEYLRTQDQKQNQMQ